MAQRDDVHTGTIVVVGFLGGTLTVCIVALLIAFYYTAQAEQNYIKDVAPSYAELSNLVSRQQASLKEYRIVDQSKGVVTIPIDRAMQLAVERIDRGEEPFPMPELPPATAAPGATGNNAAEDAQPPADGGKPTGDDVPADSAPVAEEKSAETAPEDATQPSTEEASPSKSDATLDNQSDDSSPQPADG